MKLATRRAGCAPVCFAMRPGLVVLCLALSCLIGCGPKKPAGPAFDVASVVGLKIEQAAARLGAGQELPGASQTDGRKQWRKDGYVLRADYRKRNGRVTGWTLGFEDTARTVKEEEKKELLGAAKLAESDARYSVEWEEDADRVDRFKGVQITPAPRSHKVVVRLTGQNLGTTLVQFALNVSGNTGDNPTENGLTLPPWSHELAAQDGTQIKLEAVPRTADFAVPPNAQITLHIEVDGKTVVEKTASAGGAASCDWEV